MGAGILPVTIIKGTIFFLLGRERSNNYWCDFGGSSYINEPIFDTAIREGYEELDGLLGDINELKSLVKKNYITDCKTDRYTTHIFFVNPSILYNLPYYFNNHRNFINNEIEHEINKDGYFEKSEVRLFSKNGLMKNMNDIRPFYREIITELLEI